MLSVFLLTRQKRGLVTLFVLLILLFVIPLHSVSAGVNIGKFSADKYNLGDRVLVNGQVNVSKDMTGVIWLNLVCDGKEKRMATVVLDVGSEKDAKFSQLIVIPKEMVGRCQIKTDLYGSNKTLVESAIFDAFGVVNELNAVFEIARESYQLGEKFIIKGRVSKLDGTPVNGVADFNFKQDGNTILFEQAEIDHGEIDFTKELSLLPDGKYGVDIGVSDVMGNSKSFEGLYKFLISNKMVIDAMLDKGTYSPGEILVVSGSVRGDIWRSVENVDVFFIVEERTGNFSTTGGGEVKKVEKLVKKLSLSSESFSFEKKIAGNAKSGKHKVLLEAKDADGNKGQLELEYLVRAVPTLLTLNLEKIEFIPEEKINFMVGAYDQAGDYLAGSVIVRLIDNEGKEVSNVVIAGNENGSFTLQPFAKPGNWKIISEGFGFKEEKAIVVKTYQKLDVGLDGQALNIKNIGNVKFDDELTIVADGVEKVKNIKLDVNDTKRIDLGKLFSTGIHDIEIPSVGEKFDDVNVSENKNLLEKVSGNVAKNLEKPTRKYTLFASSLIILICLAIVYSLGKRRGKVKDAREFWAGKKKLEELKKVAPSSGGEKRYKMEFGKAGKEDVEDFKRRMVKMFDEEEKKKNRSGFLRQYGENEKGKSSGEGMFNMFD